MKRQYTKHRVRDIYKDKDDIERSRMIDYYSRVPFGKVYKGLGAKEKARAEKRAKVSAPMEAASND